MVVGRFFSPVLAVLLVGTMLWGQCALCPTFENTTASEDHGCCKPTPTERDHCGTAPASEKSKQCTNHRLGVENYDKAKVDLSQLTQPALAAAPALELVSDRSLSLKGRHEAPTLHSPPELYLQNSTLLI